MADEPQQRKFVIEPLGTKHDRAAFSCGVPAMDAYLRKQARQDLKKRVAAPFVITPDGETIAGYYTLSQYAVQLEAVPDDFAKRLPKYPMVVTVAGFIDSENVIITCAFGPMPVAPSAGVTETTAGAVASAVAAVVNVVTT